MNEDQKAALFRLFKAAELYAYDLRFDGNEERADEIGRDIDLIRALTAAPASAAEPVTGSFLLTEEFREQLLDVQQDINFAANSHMDQALCDASTFIDEIDAELCRLVKAAPASAAEPVKVKPLEWNPFRAETPFGYYHIDDQTDRAGDELQGRPPFLLTGSRLDMSRHNTLAEARAAAQSDFEDRIRLTIDT